VKYEKIPQNTTFIIVFVDVSTTAAAFVGTTVCRNDTWWTVVPTKAAAVVETSTKTIINVVF